ncbi:unnamed protein product [Arctogadus glacialis]
MFYILLRVGLNLKPVSGIVTADSPPAAGLVPFSGEAPSQRSPQGGVQLRRQSGLAGHWEVAGSIPGSSRELLLLNENEAEDQAETQPAPTEGACLWAVYLLMEAFLTTNIPTRSTDEANIRGPLPGDPWSQGTAPPQDTAPHYNYNHRKEDPLRPPACPPQLHSASTDTRSLDPDPDPEPNLDRALRAGPWTRPRPLDRALRAGPSGGGPGPGPQGPPGATSFSKTLNK